MNGLNSEGTVKGGIRCQLHSREAWKFYLLRAILKHPSLLIISVADSTEFPLFKSHCVMGTPSDKLTHNVLFFKTLTIPRTHWMAVLQLVPNNLAVDLFEKQSQGGSPLSFATEIIIEIKQFNAGRMASHPFIEGI